MAPGGEDLLHDSLLEDNDVTTVRELRAQVDRDLKRAEATVVRMERVWNYVVIGGATGFLGSVLLLLAWGLTGGILPVGWGVFVVGAAQIGCLAGWSFATTAAMRAASPRIPYTLTIPLSEGGEEERETSSRVRGR